MIKFTVYNQPVRHMEGTSKAGKPYAMDIQTVYAHTLDESGAPLPVPEKVEIVLDKGQPPYVPGEYTLSPASLQVESGNYGSARLVVAPKLVPLKRAA